MTEIRTVEEEKAMIWQAIGKAMNGWSGLETSLALLFSMCATGSPNSQTAHTIFYAIENFRSKLQATDAIFQASEDAFGVKARWAQIHKHIGSRSTKRNRLAHFDVMTYPDARAGRMVAVVPPYLSVLNRIKLDAGSVRPMYLHDIEAALQEFAASKNEVLELLNFMMGKRDQFHAQLAAHAQGPHDQKTPDGPNGPNP